MSQLAKKIWNDEAGFVVSIELTLIATLAAIGLIAGMVAVRDGVVSELSDVAGATQDINQSYSLNGITGPSSFTAGFDFIDALDYADDADDIDGVADNGIVFDRPIQNEDSTSSP